MQEKTLMDQFWEIKEQYLDAVVLFQVGVFYQMYYHDAELAVQALGTKMTRRAIGSGKRIPMCGIPKDTLGKHMQTLSEHGYRVVVCSQESEGGIFFRKVTQVLEASCEKKDLTQAWKEYLDTHTFEEKTVPRKKKQNDLGILAELDLLDLDHIAPITALCILQEWKRKYL